MTTDKTTAQDFAAHWQNRGYEKGETQTFWLEFIGNVLKMENATAKIQFEKQVTIDGTTKFIDAYLPETRVLIEQKSSSVNLQRKERQSDGEMLSPYEQAERYASHMVGDENPLWIVVCNFRTIEIYNRRLRRQAPTVVPLADLHKYLSVFDFMFDQSVQEITIEKDISVEAGKIVGALYDLLLAQYREPDDHSLKSLNALCVRLVFCLYAEDAGLFGKRSAFHDYLAEFKPEQMRKALIELFKTLDTKENERGKYFADDNPALARFPYVNGGLFADESIEIPPFTEEIKQYLLKNASADFDWRNISPTIFGAVFESTLNPETRRSGGMHYTSAENIHKVIDPLFMDNLYAEFEQIERLPNLKQRKRELMAFQERMANLKFLDPACGSGNFLTETYLSLRRLENKCLSILLDTDSSGIAMSFDNVIKVNIHQFYGIEINDFAVTVAKTALWIAESQMIAETESIVQQNINFLPLHNYANIVKENALRIDWRRCFQHRNIGDEASPLREKIGNEASPLREKIGDEASPLREKIGDEASPLRNNNNNHTTLEASSPTSPTSPIYTHGNLPHWHIDGAIQFVTFRLADSLPQEKLEELAVQKEQFLLVNPKPWNEQQQRNYYKTFGKKIDEYLASGYGSCVLKQPEIRKIMDDALHFFNGKRYILHEYAIMPNHVHLLIEPIKGNTLPQILHSIKSFTANEINAALGKKGTLWQHESYDRFIRDQYHYDNVVNYIRKNIGDEASPLRNNNNYTTLEASSPTSPIYDYIMGNPPFVGARLMNETQKADMLAIFGKTWKNVGDLDYVSCWYKKAADLIQNTTTKCALVSTNSICQGSSVANLWKPLFEHNKIHIDFAYRTFRWDSESFNKAHVHCVIVGFSGDDAGSVVKKIYIGDDASSVVNKKYVGDDASSVVNKKYVGDDASSVVNKKYVGDDASSVVNKTRSRDASSPILAKNINPYLIDAPNVWIESRNKPICDVPEIGIGNKPIDDGNYLFSEEEMHDFIKLEPEAAKYFKPWYGSQEFINQKPRYCLWLGDCSPAELRRMPHCLKRVENVRNFRLASKSEGTRKLADKPTRFHVENMPKGNYIVIPETSSENRAYIPIGFLTPNELCSNALRLMPSATLYHFGVLTSSVHMAWMRAVCGRLEMRYRYSKDIVYNNFVWPGDEASLLRENKENESSPLRENKGDEASLLRENKGDEASLLRENKGDEASLLRENKGDEASPLRENKENEASLLRENKGDEASLLRENKGDEASLLRENKGDEASLLRENKGDEASLLRENKGDESSPLRENKGDESSPLRENKGDESSPLRENKENESSLLRENNNNTTLEASSPTSSTSSISQTAQAILDVRAKYPDCSLADLYDERTMPADLRKAHQENDKAVMKAYGFSPKMTESEIVAALFALYSESI